MARPAKVALLFAVLVSVTALGAPGSAASDYELTVDDSLSGPSRNVTVEGSTFTVSAVAAVERGDSFTARVDAPDATYDLYLYNADRQIVKTRRMDGSGSATFDTDQLSVGSYVLAVYGPDGKFRDIHPVVVEGYEVAQSGPNSVVVGEGGTVSVSLTELASSPDPSYVEVVVMDGPSLVTRLDATESGGSYEAALPESLDAGSYTYYAAVHGPDTVDGRRELVAMGSKAALTVESQQTTRSSSSSSGGQSSTETAATTDSSTATTDATTSATETTTTTDATTAARTETSTARTATTTGNASTGVITPSTSTARTTTSQQTLPTNGVVALGLLLALTALAFRR